MTTKRRDGADPNGFSVWIRSNPRLDSVLKGLGVTDQDYWIHRYMPRSRRGKAELVLDCLMMLEVKTFNAEPSYSQRDTFSVVDGVLRRWTKDKRGRLRRYTFIIPDHRPGRPPNAKRHVKGFGVHYLQLSGASPADSEIIRWDGKQISKTMLEELLLFERNPENPGSAMDPWRVHHIPRQKPPLLKIITGDLP